MVRERVTRKITLILLICGLLALLPLSAFGEIYKYLGKDGSIHFTDRPMSGGYRLVWRSGKTQSRKAAYSLAKMQANKARLGPLIEQIAKELRLNPGLLHAMVRVESAYDPKAVSRTGAQGLMQLMPATATRYGVENSYDPRQNLQAGARYLSDLLQEFEYDIPLALAAYNAGENAVRKYGNKIPPFPETMEYVDKVLGEYERNRLAMAN